LCPRRRMRKCDGECQGEQQVKASSDRFPQLFPCFLSPLLSLMFVSELRSKSASSTGNDSGGGENPPFSVPCTCTLISVRISATVVPTGNCVLLSVPTGFPSTAKKTVAPELLGSAVTNPRGRPWLFREDRPWGEHFDIGGGDRSGDRLCTRGDNLDVHFVSQSPGKTGNIRRSVRNRHGVPVRRAAGRVGRKR